MVKIKLDIIAGTRPNFVKIAALYSALRENLQFEKIFQLRLIHTGQHYDFNMSDSFFDQLGIPKPDYNFGVGPGTHAEQTGAIMIAYEHLLSKKGTDLAHLSCSVEQQGTHSYSGIRKDAPETLKRDLSFRNSSS